MRIKEAHKERRNCLKCMEGHGMTCRAHASIGAAVNGLGDLANCPDIGGRVNIFPLVLLN